MNRDPTSVARPNKTLRVVILDSDATRAQQIRHELEQDGSFHVDAVAQPGPEGVQRMQQAKPDVVLLVARDSGPESMDAMSTVQSAAPQARRIILGLAESLDGERATWLASDHQLRIDQVGEKFLPALRRLLEAPTRGQADRGLA